MVLQAIRIKIELARLAEPTCATRFQLLDQLPEDIKVGDAWPTDQPFQPPEDQEIDTALAHIGRYLPGRLIIINQTVGSHRVRQFSDGPHILQVAG